jgi:hypothetical protein
MKYVWRVWVKSLGEKADEDNRVSDHVALVRTGILLIYVITNLFIVANIIKNW